MVLGSLFLLSALESPTLHTYIWITIILQSATLNMKISFYNQHTQITPQGTTRKIGNQNQDTTLVSASEHDPHFPQQLSSIGTDIRKDLNIVWLHIQQFCKQGELSYSQNIHDLKQPQYCNKAITHCLHILNWFAVEIFALIFADRIVTKVRTYQFVFYCYGVLRKISVNSKVPVLNANVLFADPVGGSIFGAIFEKALAKVYGSYESIPDDVISLIQLCTGYVIQRFNPHQHTVSEFVQFIQHSHKIKNLVFFRTRKSTQLECLGLQQNSTFLIARLLKIEGKDVAEFLEFEGQKWTGKYSKKWAEGVKDTNKQYLLDSGKEGIQNYISLNDMVGISRELIILHNSQQYSVNWISNKVLKAKHIYSLCIKDAKKKDSKGHGFHCMISVNFGDCYCASCVYIICELSGELISCSYKKNKTSNFLAALLREGRNYLLYIYADDAEGKYPRFNISMHTQQAYCQIEEVSKSIFLEETSLLQFFSQFPSVRTLFEPDIETSSVSIKCLYRQIGLGAVIIKLEPDFKKWVEVRVNKALLKEYGLQVVNRNEDVIWYSPPCHSILLLKFNHNSKYKEGDPFPPLNSISITASNI